MTRLTPAQIAAVAAGAGFTGAGLTRAVAVALAESGGDTQAVNVNSDSHRSRDRGLWQINSYWHKEVSDAAAFNPATAAAAAYRISKGGKDWSPWATWTNGAAAAQLGRARFGVAQARKGKGGGKGGTTGQPAGWDDGGIIPGWPDLGDVPGVPDIPGFGDGGIIPAPPSPGEVIEGAKDTADAVKQGVVLLAHAGMWMSDPHNWVRVALVVGGGGAVILSLYMLAKSGAGGSTAAGAASKTGSVVKEVAVMAATKGKAK